MKNKLKNFILKSFGLFLLTTVVFLFISINRLDNKFDKNLIKKAYAACTYVTNIYLYNQTSPTNWRTKVFYINPSQGSYANNPIFGPTVKDSNSTWRLNYKPQGGDKIHWYNACVDPNTDVDVVVSSDSPCIRTGTGTALYETSIDVGCHNIGYGPWPNSRYAGCGTNYGNNFGTVGPDEACPTNTIYCTKAGNTDYPNACNGGSYLTCGNNCSRVGAEYCNSNGNCARYATTYNVNACDGTSGCCHANSDCGPNQVCNANGNCITHYSCNRSTGSCSAYRQ